MKTTNMWVPVTDELYEDRIDINLIDTIRQEGAIAAWLSLNFSRWKRTGRSWWRLDGVAYRGRRAFRAAVVKTMQEER